LTKRERPGGEPAKNRPAEYGRLKRGTEGSVLAGRLCSEILKQYRDPTAPETLKSLNMLCVRLVFCLYAEDAGIFGGRGKFRDYLRGFAAKDVRGALIDLFKTLDTRPENRGAGMDAALASFPCLGGGLFADETAEIPRFTDKILDLLLRGAGGEFDWSGISPAVFGAVFESTLNPETRRAGGMHDTSVENIHKVIDPLFLDGLKDELAEIKAIPADKTRGQRLRAYQSKLAGLTFLDPACGSGNFLTETYLSLRRLENEALSTLARGQISSGDVRRNPIQVSIGQFYGIEINDFAAAVARTALWIAERQMMKETGDVIRGGPDFLPFQSCAGIRGADALQIDWESVVPKAKLNYIIGNPPFVGASMMTKEQRERVSAIFGNIRLSNSVDYAGAWYRKAAAFIQGTAARAAFVSTNSITQGEQAAPLWESLYEENHIHIDFAYRPFCWESEAREKAAVHCVIIGFSEAENRGKKRIYDGGSVSREAENISPYLLDAPTVLVSSLPKPLCGVPAMHLGNKPADGGNLILTPEERDEIVIREPQLRKFIRPYLGAAEFINQKPRYCFWLVSAAPAELRGSPELRKRMQAVRAARESSSAALTRAKAAAPQLFFFISQPQTNYILVPGTSSENRRYVPVGFMEPNIIASNAVSVIPNATLFHFGVLTSNVHMAWMRTVAGRMKSDYRYSGSVVYNTFPWPAPTDAQKANIEAAAQAILDARAGYPESSLAELYDPLTMPPELLAAHRRNDRAVMQAYGFADRDMTESDCAAELMKMYQALTAKKES
jgi:hypothetical protein